MLLILLAFSGKNNASKKDKILDKFSLKTTQIRMILKKLPIG